MDIDELAENISFLINQTIIIDLMVKIMHNPKENPILLYILVQCHAYN